MEGPEATLYLNALCRCALDSSISMSCTVPWDLIVTTFINFVAFISDNSLLWQDLLLKRVPIASAETLCSRSCGDRSNEQSRRRGGGVPLNMMKLRWELARTHYPEQLWRKKQSGLNQSRKPSSPTSSSACLTTPVTFNCLCPVFLRCLIFAYFELTVFTVSLVFKLHTSRYYVFCSHSLLLDEIGGPISVGWGRV